MTRDFSNAEEFNSWNEEMIEKYHPSTYHKSSNWIIRWVERARTKRILRFLNVKPSDHVLEVGCGAGDIMEHIPSCKLWGFDISQRLVDEAKKRLGDRATLLQGDAETAQEFLDRDSFDKVYCSEVLEHVQHPDQVLIAIHDVLKSDGTAVISVPNESAINTVKSILLKTGLLKLLFPSVSTKMDDEWHLHIFTKKQMRNLCEEAGLKVKKISCVPSILFPLRYVILTTKCAE